ncbi:MULTISPECIES: phosphopantetheine-binding protein [unclassified Vibrio]|uniref:phosphopantetheine-binding protein n=1 Tax=unclassified Vibrio TaxID=2614977 RepID=UPI00354D156E
MNVKIIEIISRIAKKNVSEIESNLEHKDLWDSFAHLELILALEEEFNIMLEPEEIAEMKTPKLVEEIILKKVN